MLAYFVGYKVDQTRVLFLCRAEVLHPGLVIRARWSIASVHLNHNRIFEKVNAYPEVVVQIVEAPSCENKYYPEVMKQYWVDQRVKRLPGGSHTDCWGAKL